MQLAEKKFHTLEEGFSFIESFTNLERTNNASIRTYRLDRMRALLELFGNPQETLRTVHIAGTKGKGSTGIYLASILSETGLRTGFYSSPHVSSYTERITLAGTPFEESLYLATINKIAARLPELAAYNLPVRPSPTTFELLTLLGFLVFREASCSWAVIETGIGGRLDATNVITPELCLLTPVEREHTELLGDTLPQIAGEKAGIIKPGIPAIAGYQRPEVREVFERTAAERGSSIRFLSDELRAIDHRMTRDGSEASFTWRDGGSESFALSMPGEVQAENSALALIAARALFPDSRTLSPDALREGLRRARLPGRMELLAAGDEGVQVVLDAAHTPVSAARLLASFKRLLGERGILLFGSVLGKDPEGMAGVLGPAFDHIIVSTPGSFKKSDPEGVLRCFARYRADARLIRTPIEALDTAVRLSEGRVPILVTGSFYMVAEIRQLLVK